MLAEFDPAGRAGGHEREIFLACESFNEFRSLFKNCKVGCEVHVIYTVKAEALCRRNELAFRIRAGRIAEAFADCCAD